VEGGASIRPGVEVYRVVHYPNRRHEISIIHRPQQLLLPNPPP